MAPSLKLFKLAHRIPDSIYAHRLLSRNLLFLGIAVSSLPLGGKICGTFYSTVEERRFGKWLNRLIEEKHVSFRSTDQRSVDSVFAVLQVAENKW